MARNVSAKAAAHDPMNSVAGAWDIALRAAKNGAADAKETAGKAFPAASRLLSEMVYKTSYSLAYGVVFPTVFVAKSIPANNAVVHGFVDGARAASDWVDELKHPEPAPRPVARPSRSPATKSKKKGTR